MSSLGFKTVAPHGDERHTASYVHAAGDESVAGVKTFTTRAELAQSAEFRHHNTASATDYERGYWRWASSVWTLGTEHGGAGTSARGMRLSAEDQLFLRTAGVDALSFSTSQVGTFAQGAVMPSIGPASGQRHTLPAVAADTFTLLNATQTLAGKALTTPTIASFVNANHSHQDAAGGGTLANAALTNSSITIQGVAVPLGGAALATNTTPQFGALRLNGSTSGSVTLAVPAAAGSNTLTLPAGTTDFSATGGPNRVLMQVSAGAALTVAQLAASNLSNDVTGSGNVVLASSPTIVTPTVLSFTNAGHTHLDGAGAGTLGAGAISAGTFGTARLGSGSASVNTILRGDSTWGTVSNAALVNSSITVAGTASQITTSGSPVSLGGTVTLSLPSTINVNTSGNAATATLASGLVSGVTVTLTSATVPLIYGAVSDTTTLLDLRASQGTVGGVGRVQLYSGTYTNFAGAVFLDSGNVASLGTNDGAIVFRPKGTERMRVAGSGAVAMTVSLTVPSVVGGGSGGALSLTGNVGLGTATPIGMLSVNLAAASGNVSQWDSTYAIFGGAATTSGKALGLGYDPVSLAGEIRSIWPGVAWTDLQVRGRSVILSASSTADGTGTSVERMRVHPLGVLIGWPTPPTLSPVSKLNLAMVGSATPMTGMIGFMATDISADINLWAFRLTTAGDLALDKTQAGVAANAVTFYKETGAVGLGVAPDTGYLLQLPNSPSQKAKGNAWDTYSDERIKDRLRPMRDGLDIVRRLRAFRFRQHFEPERPGFMRNDDLGWESVGLIAQQAFDVIPEVVSRGAVPEELWGLNYGLIVTYLVSAIQALDAEVAELRAGPAA